MDSRQRRRAAATAGQLIGLLGVLFLVRLWLRGRAPEAAHAAGLESERNGTARASDLQLDRPLDQRTARGVDLRSERSADRSTLDEAPTPGDAAPATRAVDEALMGTTVLPA